MESSVTTESAPLADVVFVIEGNANLAAHLDEFKASYIVPTLEYFNGGQLDSSNHHFEHNATLYTLVIFRSADVVPDTSVFLSSPTSSTTQIKNWIEKIKFEGGAGEQFSHITEALSTALVTFDDITELRGSRVAKSPVKHCILITNSPPYRTLVTECAPYLGYTCEQVVSVMAKKNIHLSIFSPKKIASLFRLYTEYQASCERPTSPTRDFAIDPRHMVLLSGYKLQERSHTPKLEEEKLAAERLLAESSSTSTTAMQSSEGRQFKVPVKAPSQPPPTQTVASVQPVSTLSSGSSTPAVSYSTISQHAAAKPHASVIPIIPQPEAVKTVQNSVSQGSGISLNTIRPQAGGDYIVVGPNSLPNQAPVPIITAQSNVTQGFSGNVGMATEIRGQNPNQRIVTQQRRAIWAGVLEWAEKVKAPDPSAKILRSLSCHILPSSADHDLNATKWPNKLVMQLVPQSMLNSMHGLFNQSRSVCFQFTNQTDESYKSLYHVMTNGYAGCIHFKTSEQCDMKVMMLLYHIKRQMFMGIIPRDQTAFINGIRKAIYSHKEIAAANRPNAPMQVPNITSATATVQTQQIQHPTPVPQIQSATPLQQGIIKASAGPSVGLQSVPSGSEAERRLNLQRIRTLYEQIEEATQKERQFQQEQQFNPLAASQQHIQLQQQQQQLQQQQQQLQQQQLQQQQQQIQQQQQQQQQPRISMNMSQHNPHQLRHLLLNQHHVQPQQLMQQRLQGNQGGMMPQQMNQQRLPINQNSFIDDFNMGDVM